MYAIRSYYVRQFANFIGNHRKPAPLLPGPRRLDRGIQRQQICLLGNLPYMPRHAGDFRGVLQECADRLLDVIDGLLNP